MTECSECGTVVEVAISVVGQDADRVSEPFIVRPGEGRLLDLGNFEAVVLADAPSTSGAFTVLQTQGEPPDFGPPMHVHRDAAEAFFVLEGTYLMYLEQRQELCPPGSFVCVPPNVPHTFKVISQEPGKKLNIFCPAAMIGFFEELAEAQANGTATTELLSHISERYGMGIVGPVPDTYL
jgi:mannose-6-phosphate isomerase-like protein (cupin superfamily)